MAIAGDRALGHAVRRGFEVGEFQAVFKSVLSGVGLVDVPRTDRGAFQPALNLSGDKLRAVVRPNVCTTGQLAS